MDQLERTELRAGPVSLVFDSGDVRYLSVGGREIIRRLYVAVRDQNWNTIPAVLSNVQVASTDTTFRVEYDATHQQAEIEFAWHATIEGDAAGTIQFHMAGLARSTFLRNRIGFCVLHPMDCAGQPCVVEHVDGMREAGVFPVLISPHQPFRNMRAISHQVIGDLWAEVRMVGDVFEMEDQRNWTDASYKTYCTPLDLPFPAGITAGTRVDQHVSIRLHGPLPPARVEPEHLTFQLAEATGMRLPRIGLGVASHGLPLNSTEARLLRALGPTHLRVDLRLADSNYPAGLRRAATEAAALDVELEVALLLSTSADQELAALRDLLEELRPPVCTWLIFHAAEKSTTAGWIRLARQYLAGYAPHARFGAGTDAYFAELNRGRPPVANSDLVSYSINPQVHAFDDTSLVETLPAQAVTVTSARAFCGDLPIAVSPITLRPRYNPDATSLPLLDDDVGLPDAADPRQRMLFAAGWTLGSIKYLSESSVYSATYYETTGPHGIMEQVYALPRPAALPSERGEVFPIYHVLADVCELSDGMVIATRSSNPLAVEGLAMVRDGVTRVLIANLTAETQDVRLHGLPESVRLRMLDADRLHAARLVPEVFRGQAGELLATMSGELTLVLPPHGVARLDSGQRAAAEAQPHLGAIHA